MNALLSHHLLKNFRIITSRLGINSFCFDLMSNLIDILIFLVWNERFQSLLSVVEEDLRQLNCTMSSLIETGMKILLRQECIAIDGGKDGNACLIQCDGRLASAVKYLFCQWSSDIEQKVASVIANLDIFLNQLVSFLRRLRISLVLLHQMSGKGEFM